MNDRSRVSRRQSGCGLERERGTLQPAAEGWAHRVFLGSVQRDGDTPTQALAGRAAVGDHFTNVEEKHQVNSGTLEYCGNCDCS